MENIHIMVVRLRDKIRHLILVSVIPKNGSSHELPVEYFSEHPMDYFMEENGMRFDRYGNVVQW
jgi:hypothetical protein